MSGRTPWPGVLSAAAEAAGEEAAFVLAVELGGRQIHMPSPDYLRGCPDHPLSRLLGPDAAAVVAQAIGHGGDVYLPRARRACVCHLARAGVAVSEMAIRLGLSASAVRRYAREI